MKHLLPLLFLLLPLGLFSKDKGRFRHFTTEDGLSQNSVYCIVQDHQGFMWIGTSDGLCRYDGYKFTIFRPDPNDSSTISNNVIRCMLVGKDGKLWVGTREGLNCFDPVSGKFKRYYTRSGDKSALSENVILALGEDPQGRIWAASLSTGINIFDSKTSTFSHLQNDPDDSTTICGDDVRGMVMDLKGHMWLSTWKEGICEVDPASMKCVSRISPDVMGYPNMRGAILVDNDNCVWYGTWMRGIEKYDPVTKKIEHESGNSTEIPFIQTGMVWNMSWDKDGRILIATAEQGLVIFDPKTKVYRKYEYDPDDVLALNDKSVWCVMQDRSGQIWAGTWRGGVNVLDEKLERFDLIRFDSKDSTALPAATVWTMCSDGGDGLWLGTAAGPAHYDPKTKKFFHPDVFPKDPQGPAANADVQALCRDANGNIWMGTAGDGVFCYDTTRHKFKHYPKNPVGPHTIGDDIINCLYTDEEGTVWIGAGHAPLLKYDPSIDGFISIPLPAADSGIDGVYCMAASGHTDLLLGYYTGDVMRFDTKKNTFTHLWKNSTSISISALYEDKFGGVWIGTNGSGLIYCKNDKVTYFSEKDSLPNNVITGIVPGAHDEFWLSSNRGLCRFDPFSHSVRSYTPEDGLQGYEYNQASNARTPDGKLWFGGVKGFNGFYPKDILPNTTTAPAVITAFTVLNKPFPLDSDILYTKNISLTYRDYFFSFDFAGLEFTNPARNRYKYKMEGFDPDWIDAGDRRFVTYTNLDPGEYTFHVIASNNDGYWGGKEATIHISISPPFWRTNWFYTLCGITLVLAVWLFIRRRERQLRIEKEILETKVSERTHELQQEKEKVTAAHKDIKDSINYAQRIQYALLAHEELLRKNLHEHFIFFLPKDVVSGDFYWGTVRENKFYLAVCDSTGHGVPGAFMSLLNISFLNEAINEKQLSEPNKVFDHVRERLIRNISQDGEGKDGMDAILAEFVPGSNEIRYAAAHNAPIIIRGNEILQLEADKMPVGKGEKEVPFSMHKMNVQKDDVVYFFTDGFADQFGGPQGKKFKEANLRKFLLEIALLPMKEQKEKLAKQFEHWKGELEQVDDVLILGVRI